MKLIASFLALIVFVPSIAAADELSNLQNQLFFLIQEVVRLQAELNNVQKVSNLPCFTLTKDLRLGDRGDEVSGLHKALEKEGFDVGSLEKNSKLFGEKTASAVVGFQQKYKEDVLTPIGITFGTGYFGKLTRDKINSLHGCGAKPLDLTSKPLPTPKTTPPRYCNIEAVSGQNRLEGCMWLNSKAVLDGTPNGPTSSGRQFKGYIRASDHAISKGWSKTLNLSHFSIRWKGKFLFDRGRYEFALGADDKATVWINGVLLSSLSNGGTYDTQSFLVEINEAKTLDIQLDYMQDVGDARIYLGWKRL